MKFYQFSHESDYLEQGKIVFYILYTTDCFSLWWGVTEREGETVLF